MTPTTPASPAVLHAAIEEISLDGNFKVRTRRDLKCVFLTIAPQVPHMNLSFALQSATEARELGLMLLRAAGTIDGFDPIKEEKEKTARAHGRAEEAIRDHQAACIHDFQLEDDTFSHAHGTHKSKCKVCYKCGLQK